VDENIEIKKVHPKIEIPIKVLYETNSEEGSLVTFYHNDHSSIFGYECNDCHDEEACANCHADIQLETITIDIHDKCLNCHDTENSCNACHKNEISKPFNHAVKSGFKLDIFHANLECISCHNTKNSFSGLNSECTACHVNKEGYFQHEITGIKLDEMHMELTCEDCHKSNNYKIKPSCDACHDEDIAFPNSIPGIKVK
jgi:ubiquitin